VVLRNKLTRIQYIDLYPPINGKNAQVIKTLRTVYSYSPNINSGIDAVVQWWKEAQTCSAVHVVWIDWSTIFLKFIICLLCLVSKLRRPLVTFYF